MSQEHESTAPAALPEPPAIPSAPRPITPRASRRSWNEMSVRVWLVITLAVAGVFGFFAVTRIREALSDRWLIEHGTPVVAKLGLTGGNLVPKRQPRNESLPSQLIFDLNGQSYKFDIRLEPRPNAIAQQGMDFPIRVDPADPSRWTEETTVRPWPQELTALFFIGPILLLAALVTLLKRRRVLGVWRDGMLVPATVVGVRQTAVAPMSRVVRFTLRDADDRRVWSVLLPTSAGIPQPGSDIWLVTLAGDPGRALIPGLYV